LLSTGPELTIIEGFRYPSRVGGIEELVNSAEAFRRLDLGEIEDLLDKFNMRKVYAGVGWFLARNKLRWNVDDSLLDRLRSKIPSSPKYLEAGLEATFDRTWNILVPRSLTASESPDEL
jgi:hypothetical protein